MDVSNLKCFYHADKEAMGVCSVCKKKLCLDCYLKDNDNKCIKCSDTSKPVVNEKEKENKKDNINYKRNIIQIVIEILVGALIGYIIGKIFYNRIHLYLIIVCLSLVPSFQFINRIDKKIFGNPEHKGLFCLKLFIKIVFTFMLSSTLIGFILALLELYLNCSLLVKQNKKLI